MSVPFNIKQKSLFSEILVLIKYRLSFSVVLSSVASYLLAFEVFSISKFLLLITGGFLVVGASNGFNQVIERNFDALMSRTKLRPIPSGNMSVNQANLICLIIGLSGLIILYNINFRTSFYGLVSMIIYLILYTPLKRVTPLSVFFGAIPGAIPFMLGWVAVTNKFSIETGILFMIQFFWQFHHFWAIGWISHDDYLKAGFKMLPTGKKDNSTSAQILFYSFWAVIISIIPFFGFTRELKLSPTGLIVVVLLGIFLIYKSYKLFIDGKNKNARKLMVTSVIYLTFVQLTFLFDKILNL